MFAQTKNQKAEGEYYLEGVMEVGSGFKRNPDHSFEFFYAYGALDREAKGTWIQHGDSIILNNAKKPPQDFRLVSSKKTGSKEITIKILGENKTILRNVYGAIQSGDSVYRSQSDDNGILHFEKCKIEKISLIHEFWPERFSVFTVDDGDKTYFEFSIESWIADVAFVNFVLVLKENALTGQHPLLEKKEYTYRKAQ